MKKVVISGISIATPLGLTKDSMWHNLLLNKSGFSKIESFKLDNISSNIGGEIKEFANKKNKWMKILLLLINNLLKEECISKEYLKESSLVIGTSFLGIEDYRFNNDIDKIDKTVRRRYKFNGGVILNTNTCAAGNFSINCGVNLIKNGIVDKALCGGLDILSPYLYAGFDSLRLLSKKESVPFSKDHNGMALGEGGSLLLLESLESAKRRKARIYCEVLGFGASCDNLGITGMDKTGKGIKICFDRAIKKSKIFKKNIDLINTHGTGTKLNDLIEANIIKSYFGDKIDIEAFKSYFGHTMGSSSGIQAALLSLIINKNKIIKIRNLDKSTYELNFVTINTNKKINSGLNNAFGFGGINSTLVLGKFVK